MTSHLAADAMHNSIMNTAGSGANNSELSGRTFIGSPRVILVSKFGQPTRSVASSAISA